MRIACALALMTELSGAKTDMHQTTHAESIRDIRLVNYILQELANDGELLNSGQGIKKLNSLHNALEFLIKDTPIDALKTQVNKAQNVFHNTIAPRYSLFRFESGTAAFYARGKYIDEVAQRENLGGAGDLLPTHLQKLIEVRSKPLIACES